MDALAAPLRRLFLAAGAFSLVINLALLAPSLYMLQVFDRVLATRSLETLGLLSLITGGALLLMALLDALRARLLALAGCVFEDAAGSQALGRVLDGVARDAAADAAWVLRDVAAVRAFLFGPGVIALFDAPWMLVYVGVIFVFSALLGGLALGSALALVALAWTSERATRGGIERAQAAARDAARFADAALRNVEVVRAMGMAAALGARWRAMNRALQRRQLATQRAGGAIGAATRGLRQSVQVAMMGLAAWLVIEQKATPGVMIAATIILGRALAPVELLIGQWKPLVEARAAWRRLDALLGPARTERFAALPAPSGALAIENLLYLAPGTQRPIVRGVNLEVAAGEVLAIVGPSGSGKSTLARLVLGIERPAAGSVRLDGADVAQWSPARLGEHVGYLPQEVALFAGTVAENIARFGDAAGPEVVAAAERVRAHALVVRLPEGYDTPVGEAGQRLSGGQRQRIALARALYGRPRLVVLDEPNAYLDAEGEQALAAAIGELRAAGATVVLITQRTQILAVADRIAVMRDGTIERIGLRQERPVEAASAGAVPVLHPTRQEARP